jgi:Tol biopolymer transport system component
VLEPNGGRLSWSVQGDWIAFDQRGADGFYDLYLMAPNGGLRKCLTCELFEFRKAHAYNPTWHPSGKYLVFQVQAVAGKLGLSAAEMTSPDRGLHSALWVIDRAGKNFWQLTGAGRGGNTVLDPCFSHEGGQLAFSERFKSKQGRWGEWAVRVADFEIKAGVPRLKNVRTFQPGVQPNFIQVDGFAPSDDALLVSGNLDGQSESGMDVYRMSLAGGALARVTRTPSEWDEGARFSPAGDRIAWTSDRDALARRAPPPPARFASARAQRRDLWLMREDAADQERITFFNHPAAPESLRGAVVSDFDWSPDGRELAVHVVTDLEEGVERIYMVRLRAQDEEPAPTP